MITWAGEPQEGEEQTLKKKSTAKAIKLCDIKFHLEEEEEEDEPPEPAAPATKTQRRYSRTTRASYRVVGQPPAR